MICAAHEIHFNKGTAINWGFTVIILTFDSQVCIVTHVVHAQVIQVFPVMPVKPVILYFVNVELAPHAALITLYMYMYVDVQHVP